MAVIVYATSEELAAWTQLPLPTNAAKLLRSASLLVRDATKSCVYATDVADKPSDTKIRDAFRDAVCAQAAFWAGAGIDPTQPMVTAPVLQSKAIGSARLTYDTGGTGSLSAYRARVRAASELCDESIRLLQDSGLNLTAGWMIG